jgi:hypothetical protein
MNEIAKVPPAHSRQDTEATNWPNGWFGTSQARLATLYGAYTLIHSDQIMDLTLLAPR